MGEEYEILNELLYFCMLETYFQENICSICTFFTLPFKSKRSENKNVIHASMHFKILPPYDFSPRIIFSCPFVGKACLIYSGKSFNTLQSYLNKRKPQ